jgi:uncharacterized protein (TIGR02677 family)
VSTAELFRHVSADKAALYRAVLDVFAGAKRQYRLQLRPDEVQAEADWAGMHPYTQPGTEELAAALTQLVAWGNLESQPDIARVTNLADYYRARYLYRLSQGGEAVEASLATYAQMMARRAELQTVALEDITHRLQALAALLEAGSEDVPKLHETLRDLVRVFEGLADNAQAFMAGVARSLELQRADEVAVLAYKQRLIDYLERFVGDLVQRSEAIGQLIGSLGGRIEPVLLWVAEREAGDAAPGDEGERADEQGRRWRAWRERWKGLRGWFLPGGVGTAEGPAQPQAELLRARARAAIPQLLAAVAAVNERRSGRSDRSADFRALAGWFAACANDDEAHRLARAAFALNPARHLALNPVSDDDAGAGATTPWAEAPPLAVHPRLREQGLATPRGAQPRVRLRDAERAQLAALMQDETRKVEAARRQLAHGRPVRLSEIGSLDDTAFGFFLSLLGEALAEQAGPDAVVERHTGDGQFQVRLQPLAADSHAEISTPSGRFAGRDHLVTIRMASEAGP